MNSKFFFLSTPDHNLSFLFLNVFLCSFLMINFPSFFFSFFLSQPFLLWLIFSSFHLSSFVLSLFPHSIPSFLFWFPASLTPSLPSFFDFPPPSLFPFLLFLFLHPFFIYSSFFFPSSFPFFYPFFLPSFFPLFLPSFLPLFSSLPPFFPFFFPSIFFVLSSFLPTSLPFFILSPPFFISFSFSTLPPFSSSFQSIQL